MTSHRRRVLVAISAALCLALCASTGALAASGGDEARLPGRRRVHRRARHSRGRHEARLPGHRRAARATAAPTTPAAAQYDRPAGYARHPLPGRAAARAAPDGHGHRAPAAGRAGPAPAGARVATAHRHGRRALLRVPTTPRSAAAARHRARRAPRCSPPPPQPCPLAATGASIRGARATRGPLVRRRTARCSRPARARRRRAGRRRSVVVVVHEAGAQRAVRGQAEEALELVRVVVAVPDGDAALGQRRRGLLGGGPAVDAEHDRRRALVAPPVQRDARRSPPSRRARAEQPVLVRADRVPAELGT